MLKRFPPLALLTLLALIVCGCDGEDVHFEVKQVSEKITDAELESFRSIIDGLPDHELPPFPSTLLSRPHWTQERTLPIQDLVRQEIDAHEDAWSVDLIARQLPKNQRLMRLLRREQMSPEQFVSLTLALGAALSADAVDKRIDLAEVVKTGQRHVKTLKADETAFSTLSDERAHEILAQAAWITVVNRAQILLTVPPENLLLVRKNHDWLVTAFPEHFTRNPLEDLTNVMQQRGIPFEEMPQSGSDERIHWKVKDAILGEIPDDVPLY